ncbi:putative RNA-directed DNA polymerase (Reverse transcriptase), Ribonuclease H [Cucumis melo var. makuwa]|uniref:RNA-directed DNA polymerase (Reverse transcriptase), Ribonuclease H n=1 Tax=Cucumis melo var. makuwa TaxID=1194695 RepID=A0A5A7TLW4_CUCMM|nr:putative RNA-directed DNA polymerase (Reverse transcriptase), Ribonuclease H [Cucumis melo var. makuwa]
MTISLRIVGSSRIRGTKVEGDIDDVIDFEVSIYNLKQNIEEDEYDISPELLRLIEQEKNTMSYQETLKVTNLGIPEEVKEVSNGHRFILVAIDYITKWVEAASYKGVTKHAVVKFIRKNIICRYGLPERIITDNGKNLNNKLMEELCSQFKVKHYNSTPYCPKMNGVVISGATPLSLVYGLEAVLPVEVEVSSLRVIQEVELDEAKWAQVRYKQLNFIEERRLTALCKGQLYQKKIA